MAPDGRMLVARARGEASQYLRRAEQRSACHSDAVFWLCD